MNKILLITILALLIGSHCEKKPWRSDTKLNWSNFRGVAPLDRGLKTAVTSVQIEIDGEFFEGEIPTVNVLTYFLPEKSWTIVNDSMTLRHEQLHFDIAELYARKIRKEFKILNNNGVLDFEIYEQKYLEYIERHNRTQMEYDNKVYFNHEKQEKWVNDVANELKKLQEYEYISKE